MSKIHLTTQSATVSQLDLYEYPDLKRAGMAGEHSAGIEGDAIGEAIKISTQMALAIKLKSTGTIH